MRLTREGLTTDFSPEKLVARSLLDKPEAFRGGTLRVPLRKIGGGEWGMLRCDYVRWVRGDLDAPEEEPALNARGSKYLDVLAPRRQRRGA